MVLFQPKTVKIAPPDPPGPVPGNPILDAQGRIFSENLGVTLAKITSVSPLIFCLSFAPPSRISQKVTL